MHRDTRKFLAIAFTCLFPPALLWWIPPTKTAPSIMVVLFGLDEGDATIEERKPDRHATYQDENVYKPGVGWVKRRHD